MAGLSREQGESAYGLCGFLRLLSIRTHAGLGERDRGKLVDADLRIAEVASRHGVGEPSYACPKCGAVSHNPHDLANRYCAACHVFEGDAADGSVG
jgi:hypothetical protein